MAKDPSGKEINALAQHIQNLLTPSTPFFFNTLYDPFRQGADFVRGYPFSLREGVPTAISHGLWLNIPDYDAPTQLVKPLERNTRFSPILRLFVASLWIVNKSMLLLSFANLFFRNPCQEDYIFPEKILALFFCSCKQLDAAALFQLCFPSLF